MDPYVTQLIDEFFSKYRLKRYSKGQILMLNGDNPGVVYQLVSGRVKQYDITYRGEEIILNVFKPPAFFPMSLAINHGDNLYTYEAETDVEVRQARDREVVAFLNKHPEVMFDLLGRVYRGIDGLLGRMTHLMTGSAKARLMFELLIACRRFGEKLSTDSYLVRLNEGDIAARAGLSRETVSREMKKLKKEGFVVVKPKSLIIKNFTALEERIGKVV